MVKLLYEYPTEKVRVGQSLGNLEIFARLTSATNLGGLWSSLDDENYCGKWFMSFYVNDNKLSPQSTLFNSFLQSTLYAQEGTEIRNTFFIPFQTSFLRVAYFVVSIKNMSSQDAVVKTVSDIEFPELVLPEFVRVGETRQRRKEVVTEITDGFVVGKTKGKENEVRLIQAPPGDGSMTITSRGILIERTVTVAGGEEKEFPYFIMISNNGLSELLSHVEDIQDYKAVKRASEASVERLYNTLNVCLPNATIMRAFQWAKIDICRVIKYHPYGFSFTNNPPQDVLVIRDAAWFIFGTDYLFPGYSRGIINFVQKFGVEEGGKLTEYILCNEDPPQKDDYRLNINDNTPLFLISCYHHYAMTQDKDFLTDVYPLIRDAARWIIGQKKDGLVYCDTEEANVWGICSWRNIIPEYQINGAVTEINSQCVLALRAAARLAAHKGFSEDAALFQDEANSITKSVNEKLVSEKTRLYVLNTDTAGQKHHNVTGDLVFPLMCGVADDAMRERILSRLYSEDFWTEFGIRTVSKNEYEYDPGYGSGLLGGVWPNLSLWLAYASRSHPDKLVALLENTYKMCEREEPKKYKNVVPGQFPEYMDGEDFQSLGMTLSPWVPSTYVWAVMEGLLGIEPGVSGRLKVNPVLPQGWTWAALKDMPYLYSKVSFFIYGDTLYSTQSVDTSLKLEVYPDDAGHLIKSDTYFIALLRKQEAVVFIASHESRNVKITLDKKLFGHTQEFEFFLNANQAVLMKFPVDLPSVI